MPRFAEQVEVAIEALSTNPPQAFEENEFIDASRLVYDGVRDIRKAVLMIRVRPLSYLAWLEISIEMLCRNITTWRQLVKFLFFSSKVSGYILHLMYLAFPTHSDSNVSTLKLKTWLNIVQYEMLFLLKYHVMKNKWCIELNEIIFMMLSAFLHPKLAVPSSPSNSFM